VVFITEDQRGLFDVVELVEVRGVLEREGVVALVASERTVEVVLQRGDLGSSSVGEEKSIRFSVSISLVVEGVLEFSRDIFWGVMLRRLDGGPR